MPKINIAEKVEATQQFREFMRDRPSAYEVFVEAMAVSLCRRCFNGQERYYGENEVSHTWKDDQGYTQYAECKADFVLSMEVNRLFQTYIFAMSEQIKREDRDGHTADHQRAGSATRPASTGNRRTQARQDQVGPARRKKTPAKPRG